MWDDYSSYVKPTEYAVPGVITGIAGTKEPFYIISKYQILSLLVKSQLGNYYQWTGNVTMRIFASTLPGKLKIIAHC